MPAILLLALTAVGCRKTTVGVPAGDVRAAAPSPVYRADLSGAWSRVGPKGLADDPTKVKEFVRGRLQKAVFVGEEKKALAGTLLLAGGAAEGGAWRVPAALAGHQTAVGALREEQKKPPIFTAPGSVTLDSSTGGSSHSPEGSTGSWARDFQRGFKASADDASAALKGMKAELEKVVRAAGGTVTEPRAQSKGGRTTAFTFAYEIGDNKGKVRGALEGSEAGGYLLKVHIEEKVE